MSIKEPKLKPYLKKLEYSYTFGSYPTLELLKYKKENALKVIFHSQSDKSEGAGEVLQLCKEHNIKYEYNDYAVEKIAYKENTYLIGIFNKYKSEIGIGEDQNHVALVNPKNMGNIGTIIRTMVGLGVYNLAIIRPAADIFDPKVIRSTMGAFFQINFQYFESVEEYLLKFNNPNGSENKYSLYPFMLNGASDINEVSFKSPFGLIFGNEGEGLPDQFNQVGTPIYIPQSGDIDSLNLSVSATIGLWESLKRSR